MGRYEDALEAYYHASESDPDDAFYIYQQADVLISQGSKIPDVVRKAVSDLTLDKLILAEAAKGNF